MSIVIAAIFILGYLLIATEHFVKINKSATALLTGVLCWTLYMVATPDRNCASVVLQGHLADIAGILFFLMGAMTIVEIIDAHNGFATVTSMLAAGSRQRLLWLTGAITFVLASVLGNLTTTIVMVSLLSKIITKREDLLQLSGVVVIVVNAGGAWSPIGDVTTTMLWISGCVSSLSIVKVLILPSLICALVPLVMVSLRVKNAPIPALAAPNGRMDSRDIRNGKIVFFLGFGVLLFVPVFKGITHLPPYVGVLFGLGVLWTATEVLHRKSDKEHRQEHSVASALQRIDMSTILFFLGILLAISSLQAVGILAGLAGWLDRTIGNVDIIAIALGVLSSVVDNVPLVAAGIRMYPLSQFPMDHQFWPFLSYCVGTGGSMLIIGSAAGVAAMGMAKIDFFWYMRRIAPLAVAGYCAGAGVYLLQMRLF
jgi:Na+/H+ antiporter NhaD/arsenite permease-like protein